MILKRVKVNVPYVGETNCYIVQCEKTKEAMVIDPGGEVDKIVEMLNTIQAKLKYILLTHCHADHIAGVSELKDRYGGKVLIHRYDEQGLKEPDVNLGEYVGIGIITIEADARVDDNDLLHVGEIEFKVIHTPGHTKGGICLYSAEKKLLFSGDTMFRGSWGRTDLPTSNFADIINSITNKLMPLPEDTIVYPGHRKINNDKRRRTHLFGIKTKTILEIINCSNIFILKINPPGLAWVIRMPQRAVGNSFL